MEGPPEAVSSRGNLPDQEEKEEMTVSVGVQQKLSLETPYSARSTTCAFPWRIDILLTDLPGELKVDHCSVPPPGLGGEGQVS